MGGLILFAIVLCIWVFAKQDIKYYPQILFVCMAFTFLLGVINISKENHEIDDEIIIDTFVRKMKRSSIG